MPRILVIEDDEQTRGLLREMLERAGYEVADVANGDLGLKKQRENPCQLVITDILMPDKEGIETIMELRKDDPRVPIIAGGLDYLAVAKNLGARRTFAKPVDRRELLAAVADELAH